MSAARDFGSLDLGADWTRRYEDLRRQASAQPGWTDQSWGLALLINRGVVAWMRAWPQRVVPVERRQSRTVPDHTELPSDLHHQVALVLADMILNGECTSLEATA